MTTKAEPWFVLDTDAMEIMNKIERGLITFDDAIVELAGLAHRGDWSHRYYSTVLALALGRRMLRLAITC